MSSTVIIRYDSNSIVQLKSPLTILLLSTLVTVTSLCATIVEAFIDAQDEQESAAGEDEGGEDSDEGLSDEDKQALISQLAPIVVSSVF